MDLVLKLREIRRMRGLSQKDVARLSGVGEKTISSFETGQRIGSLKLAQLKRLLAVYGLTEADFFGATVEKQIAPWELDEQEYALTQIVDELRALPKNVQKSILGKFQLMLETASEVHGIRHDKVPGALPSSHHEKRPPYRGTEEHDWQLLTSRN